jgi:hypothetical protein
MFETWRRFDPRQVASFLSKQRKLLQHELRATTALIAASHDVSPQTVAARVRTLQERYRGALSDIVATSQTMQRSIFFLDLLKFTNAIIAQTGLVATACEVYEFLSQLGVRIEAPYHKANGAIIEPSLHVDFDTLIVLVNQLEARE